MKEAGDSPAFFVFDDGYSVVTDVVLPLDCPTSVVAGEDDEVDDEKVEEEEVVGDVEVEDDDVEDGDLLLPGSPS